MDLKIIIAAATEQSAEVAINYGMFIQKVIDFLIIALVVFFIVKGINSMREKMEARKKVEEAKTVVTPPKAPAIAADIKLLTEIRDLLKKQKV